jgi:uncharacterized protein YqfA (UPF0365 family)
MGIEVAALAISAAVGAYSAREQHFANSKARDTQSNASAVAQAQDLEARRIAASAKPMEEQATLVTGGSKGNVLGNLGLMVEPTAKPLTTLGGTTKTGLGFGSNS